MTSFIISDDKQHRNARKTANPFIRAGNPTGLALEFFTAQLSRIYITRQSADFLRKICNVAAASDAYQLYYSKASMAERAGVCEKSVQRYMRVIEAAGIMTRTAVSDSIKGHQPNVYTFTPAFLNAVRTFFTKTLSREQIKTLRQIAPKDLKSLVDTALMPFKKAFRKILSLDAAKAFFASPPRGQNDAWSRGQNAPQEVVRGSSDKKVNQTPSADAGNNFFQNLKRVITGEERREMTAFALNTTRDKRRKESAQQVRAACNRKYHAENRQKAAASLRFSEKFAHGKNESDILAGFRTDCSELERRTNTPIKRGVALSVTEVLKQ